VFGVDTQLILDGTYFVAEADNQIAGYGGRSKRRPCSAVTKPSQPELKRCWTL